MGRPTRLVICCLVLLVGCKRTASPQPGAAAIVSPPPVGALLVGGACRDGARCYETIGAAMQAAQPGDTIVVAAETYTEAVTFSQPDLNSRGSGMPEYRDRQLLGGTIVVGSIDCNGQPGAKVLDLGVVAAPEGVNAVVSGKPGHGQIVDHTFENLALLGPGYAARTHALLSNSGSGVTVRNLRMYHWYHGLALKCVDATVEDVYGLECAGSTIIVKSDDSTGDAARISIRRVGIDGVGRGQQWGGSIVVQSAAAAYATFDVTIHDVTARNASRGAILIDRLDGLGSVSAITVTQVVSERAGSSANRADFDVSAASDVRLEDCSSTASRGYGFRARDGASGVVVVRGQVIGARAAEYDGAFDRLEINGRSVVP